MTEGTGDTCFLTNQRSQQQEGNAEQGQMSLQTQASRVRLHQEGWPWHVRKLGGQDRCTEMCLQAQAGQVRALAFKGSWGGQDSYTGHQQQQLALKPGLYQASGERRALRSASAVGRFGTELQRARPAGAAGHRVGSRRREQDWCESGLHRALVKV